MAFEDGCEIMPQQAICQQCGAILYKGVELIPPDEVIRRHNGKCPTCGKKLAFTPVNVEVKPIG
ncbi:MAG: hypothetical protein AOA65_2313 [Candidatus Bathyarchaeota archaeon BA1]|nr:MAG: hypothetical protein AOA65_2313 [Candidatus Bathyarchaeota archaeon BA1]